MDTIDPMVSALIALCKAEGGEKFVADKAAVSAENLTQITKGVKLPSGNPRGVGPGLRAKITKAYPGWLGAPITPFKTPQVTEQNQPLAHVNSGVYAIESVATSTVAFAERLSKATPRRQAAVLSLLAEYGEKPNDKERLSREIDMLLSQEDDGPTV